MKIAIIPGAMQGSSYYRGIVPGIALNRYLGHKIAFIDNRNDMRMRDADVIQCQRRVDAETLGTLWALQDQYETPFLHDIDDNFNALPSTNPMAKVLGNGTMNNLISNNYCAKAKVLTVSTPDLAREYANINEQIALLPNAVDDLRLEEHAPKEISGEPKRAGEIRIGWAGSNTHRADLELVIPTLRKLLEEFDNLKVIFFGDDLRTLFVEKNCGCITTTRTGIRPCKKHGRQLEYAGNAANARKFYPSTEYNTEELQSLIYYRKIKEAHFDIGIAPVVENSFNRSKSYLKLIEYGMLGIPSIAQRFGPYLQYVQEAPGEVVPALLASTKHDWYDGLKSLITDATLRRNLAQNNLAYVNHTHVISKRVRLWESAFEWAAGRLVPA